MNPEDEIRKLKEKIRELEEENAKIKKEFEEFKAKHTTTVSELRKALRIKPNTKSIPAFGAPKGHKGYARHIP